MNTTFSNANNLWILIAAALVFFMQAGFKVLETGLIKTEHRTGIGVKNLMDWVAGSIAFFFVGFGFMFGDSHMGIIGTDHFLGLDFSDDYTFVFFVFQLAFAGTALTIVSGAMSGRTALMPYFVASFFTAIIVYPIFGHWAWGNLLNADNAAWLADIGFMDFAGSTVVHSVGAWVGLVGIWIVGPRLGRYNSKGEVQPVKASDYSYSILGLMILWLGWWGFNGGSTLAFDGSVAKIVLNTNLAAAAACFSAYLHAIYIQRNRDSIEKMIGGALAGLVAITACCNVVSAVDSVIIGFLAGVIHNIAYVLITEKWKLDDPVGAIPVHGFGGIFGTLCVALFGEETLLVHDRWTQLVVQLVGILVCMIFTISFAYFLFTVIKYVFGLRLSPQQEIAGEVFGRATEPSSASKLIDQIVSQVSVRISDHAYNLFSVPDYLKLPRATRQELVLANGVQYLDEYGNQVPPITAVNYLAGVVEDQKDEALSEKQIVESSLSDTDSDFIGNIQNVLMGDETNVLGVFPNSFIYFQPRFSVSTDFFWHAKEKGYKIAVVGSSIEGGFPRAFLSALSISLLNEIVGIKQVIPPEKILGFLDQKLIVALQQSNKVKHGLEGVEMGILVVNRENNTAYFAGSGARIRLYYKPSEHSVQEIKGLDLPLGKATSQLRKFERIKIQWRPKDCFYLCTEGFANQINSVGKRFSYASIKELFDAHADKPMSEQRTILETNFEHWKGDEDQIEDVLIMGIRV